MRRRTGKRIHLAIGWAVWYFVASIVSVFSGMGTVQPLPVHAGTGLTTTLGASGAGATAWSIPANANGTTDDNVWATAVVGKGESAAGAWTNYGFDSSLPANLTITKVEIIPQYHISTTSFTSTLNVQAVVGGAVCPASPVTDGSKPTADVDVVADVTSCRTWIRADLLNTNFATQITANRSNAGGQGNVTFSLDYVKVQVTYDTPDYTQAGYKVFKNADSTDVGVGLASQNIPANAPYPSSRFRLRLLIRITATSLGTGGAALKLQFVGRGSGTCSSPSGGTPSLYTDVTPSTLIAYADNSPANGVSLTANASDPTDGANTVRRQTYVEANNFSNTVSAINANEDGEWDFALRDNGAPSSTAYCMRVVEANGAVFGSYLNYPQITTAAPGTLGSDIVDAGGSSVASPSIVMSAISKPFDCVSTSGTLGTATQRMRVTNSLTATGWSLSIAATGGSTALWSAGTPKYDFNDASGSPSGCAAGLDSDSYAGKLSLNPSVAAITAQAGCNSTGISAGSQSAFAEGSIDSITLMTGTSSSELGCYWDLTGVAVSQKIPALQAEGNYLLNLTITVVSN